MTADDTTPALHRGIAAAIGYAKAHGIVYVTEGSIEVLIRCAAPLIAARAAADQRERWAAPLADAVEGMHEMIGYVPDYFRDKWEHQAYIDRAEKALADLLAAQDTP